MINLIKNAAIEDREGTDSQLLIQCLGRYEMDGVDNALSDRSKTTNSYFAPAWHDDDSSPIRTVYGKADYEIIDNGDKYIIDLQIYLWYQRNGQWECRFEEYNYAPLRIKIDTFDDGGANDTEFTLSINGVKVINGENDAGADDRVLEEIDKKIAGLRPEPNTGWSDIWVKLVNKGEDKEDASRIPIYDFFDGFSIYDSEWEYSDDGYTAKTEFQLIVGGMRSTDRQVYSRTFSAWQPKDVKVTINKVITNQNNYSSNFFNLPEYNLNGTTFKLYETQDSIDPILDSDGNIAIWTISGTTGGLSKEIKLPSKWANEKVWLEETLPSAATGFKKPTRVQISLPDAGQANTYRVENEPLHDPVFLSIEKYSPQTNSGKFAADVHFTDKNGKGIEYTLAYFGERSNSQSNAGYNTGAVNTWKFETDEFGKIDFTDDDYCTSGTNTLYKVGYDVNYPVGWYRIWESSPSEFVEELGLEASKHFYCVHLKNDDNAPFDIFIDGTTTEYKNPHGDTASAEIEESRKASFEENEHWEQFAFVKKDIYLASGKPEGDAKLDGAVFTVYSEDRTRFDDLKDHTYDGNTYYIGTDGEVLVNDQTLTIEITASGRGICLYPLPKTDNEIGKRFYIMETTAPEGYKMPISNKYYVDYTTKRRVYDVNSTSIPLTIKNIEDDTPVTTDLIYTIKQYTDIVVNEVPHKYTESEAGTAYNAPKTGIIEVYKYDDDSDDGKSQGDGSLQGIEFAIVNRSKNPVYYNNKEISVGSVVTILRTDSTGYAKATKLPYGTYDVYELSEDHTLSSGSAFSESKALRSLYANSSYTVADADDYCLTEYDKAVIHPDDDSDDSVELTYEIENAIVRGDIKVVKKDNEITEVQGDASFAGIRYAIVNRSKKPVKVNGYTYEVGDVVYIIETNSNGVAEIPFENSLPYGTYDIYELRYDSGVSEAEPYDTADKGTSIYSNSDGYLFTENTTVAKSPTGTYNVNNRNKKVTEFHVTYTAEFTNVVSNGKLTVQKHDDDAYEEQGDATFNGIKFAVVNRSKHPVYYENHKCDVDTVVAVHTTTTVDGVNGIAVFENLPYGSYQVYELGRNATITPNTPYPANSTAPSLGDTRYANDSYMLKNPGSPDRQVSGIEEIHPDNYNRVVVVETEIANAPARGTITVTKYDKETLATKYNGAYQGDTDFEGIRYAIVNASKKFVKIDGTNYTPGAVVGIITTNKEGFAQLDNTGEYSLPYGTYDIYELRLDATIEAGDIYAGSNKLGTSIWANDHGYLYTEDPNVAESDAHTTFTIDKRQQKVFLDEYVYNSDFTNVPAKGTMIL